MAWPYSKQPFDHTIETFFILLSVYSIYSYAICESIRYLLIAGASIGFAFITRQTSLLAMPSLFVLMVVCRGKISNLRANIGQIARDTIFFLMAFLPFLFLSFWYNYYRFGSIFETGYQLMADRMGIDYFKSTSLLKGISGLLISPGKGFFYYSPVALLFFFAIKAFIKRYTGLGASFVLFILSYLLFFSKYVYWHGDWAWGPRYIFAITPFLMIPVAEFFESVSTSSKKAKRLAVALIFILSVTIQIGAVSVDFQKYFLDLKFVAKISSTLREGKGVQIIQELPSSIYYDWKRSPIISQFVFIYEIAGEIKDYRYKELSENAAIHEPMETYPSMHVFDFWWVYLYYYFGNYYGFIIAIMLLLIAIFYGSRLWKYSRHNNSYFKEQEA